jgi:hypothetical protein
MGRQPRGTALFGLESRPGGLDLAARRLEWACGAIRAEIGRARGHERWSGLLGRPAFGRSDESPAIKGLARDLDDAARGGGGETALVPAFLLRQLEIAMNLMSGVLAAVKGIERRLREVERRLAVTEARTIGGPVPSDTTRSSARLRGGVR